VSQFLRELNETPTAGDAGDVSYALDDGEMRMFTNSEFYDFETGQNTDFQPQPCKPESDGNESRQDEPVSAVVDEFPELDFMSTDFNFPDFNATYTSPTVASFSDNLGHLPPIQPTPQQAYPPVPERHQQQPAYAAPAAPRAGDKRKADGPSPSRPTSFEEATRMAAEEDKRRRNTAASARFRIKKKQREQALEKSAKEMTDKVTALEGKIQQLETENKWLKNIVLEKNGGSEDFLAKLIEDFNNRGQPDLKKGAAGGEVSNLKAPTSPEERDAGDSSG